MAITIGNRKISTSLQLTLSFVLVAFIGSLILSFPFFHQPSTDADYFDHLLTAISLVCVSGMAALPIAETYNLAGQVVALLLIQVGGLGVITILNVGIFYINRRLSLQDQYLLQQSLSRDTNKNLLDFLLSIYKFTIATEIIGALIIMYDFVPRFGLARGAFNALFLSISSFSNSGFHNLYTDSLEGFYNNPLILLTVSALVIAGGIGFSVWFELVERVTRFFKSHPRSFRLAFQHLSVHTRVVLMFTSAILILGTVLFLAAEWTNPNTIGEMSPSLKFLNAFFNTTNTRTAGYTSVNYFELNPFTKLSSMIQTIIGGAPGGTAGGIKVTSFAILVLLFKSEIQSYNHVVAFKRIIPSRLVKQAVIIVLFFVILLFTGYGTILLLHPHLDSLDILFETANALGSAGISFNTIVHLNPIGVSIMVILMIAGRVGPITLLLGILQRRNQEIHYAETNIFLG
ncbi:TrkH family potassium uptake protein [Aerococcaceae bacterium DSM 111021]|nr:TrkH family potassium uptake protein [Aerococcaceae bacterium DSM 111021]